MAVFLSDHARQGATRTVAGPDHPLIQVDSRYATVHIVNLGFTRRIRRASSVLQEERNNTLPVISPQMLRQL
jgi:hypothetical protein